MDGHLRYEEEEKPVKGTREQRSKKLDKNYTDSEL